ncbi:MAG: amidase [Chloroflexi bacterium]|nr:amidase [Chloroflexota bacterium]
MNAPELARETIAGLTARYRARQVSPVEVTQAVLDRIAAVNPLINAYVTVTAEQALVEARAAERALVAGGEPNPLLGIPIGIKDLYDTQGVVTAAGSKILAGRIPDADATSIARLRAAGAVIVGKTNTHEFAYGGTTQNPHYGGTRNPWNLDHDPGGSSGGSGAALAAHACIGATGSDTGGSIRSPAAACGIVGIKPTFGRVPVTGIFPLGWSSDTAGPMTKCVEDAALMLNVLAGYDPADAGSADVPVPDFAAGLRTGIRGIRIGVVAADPDEPDDADIGRNFEAAVQVLADLGAELRVVRLPPFLEARRILRTIIGAEAAEIHRRWLDERPEDYGEDVRERLIAGRSLAAADLAGAYYQRRSLLVHYRQVLEDLDLLVLRATPTTAARIGEDLVEYRGRMVPRREIILRYFSPFNLTGFPAIVLPNGLGDNGLPTGLQIAGRPWDEATVLRAAYAFEQATPWHELPADLPRAGAGVGPATLS